MAHSIDGVGNGPLNPAQQQVQASEVKERERPADTRNESAAPSDRLTLTPQARQLKGLEARVAQMPVVDAEKVQRLRDDIAQGRYQVNPERVAEKMLQFEQQVFGAIKDG